MPAGGSRAKDIFSTHDAAKICRVTPMTVIRWIKEGKIPAFKTAGGHRRILRGDLVRFCKARGMPFPPEAEPEAWRILVVDADAAIRNHIAEIARRVDDKLLIEMAGDAWSAGQQLASFRPNLIVLDEQLPGIDALDITARLSRERDGEPPSIAVLLRQPSPDGERAFRSRGAIACLSRPPADAAVERVVRTTFQLPEQVAGGSTPVIHIVDPDPRAARALRREIEEKVPGCRVTVFDSALDAVFALSTDHPDLLLLDIADMDLHPTDVLKSICARAGQPAFPVLAAGRAEAQRAGALAAGARSFLVKPCQAEQILEHLRAGESAGGKLRKRGK